MLAGRLQGTRPAPTTPGPSPRTEVFTRNLGSLPGAIESRAFGINNRGQITGVSTAGPPLRFGRAFLWDRGTMVDLGVLPGADYSEGAAINDRGQVVGMSSSSSFAHAFLWDRGVM